VTCLGSSTTASKGTYKWITALEKRAENKRFRFVNLGVGGDLSHNLLQRIGDAVATEPDRVIVLIGTNDILASVFPAHRRFAAVFKGLSTDPSPEAFKRNLVRIAGHLQQRTNAKIALSSLAPVGEDLQSTDPVQARLNQLITEYNHVIHAVSLTSETYYIPFYERFEEKLNLSQTRKPFNRFSFLSFYRDYMFREMLQRRSFDDISRINGWEFHVDGIHLNTKGGSVLTDVVQQFLDS
jgi:lysophospholipase L1-like esterase